MKVLSLFDWIACGYEALLRAQMPIDKYFASEIDKYAIQVAMKNHPDIIQVWDVTKLTYHDWSLFGSDWPDDVRSIDWPFDLIIGWSPCQWFSMAGKMLNFNDPRSKLFFEFVRLVKECKPKFFLLENVKMKKEFIAVINEQLWWITPTQINSSLVSAQNRVRNYWVWKLQDDWTYTKVEIPQPEDRWILLKDILEDNVDESLYFTEEKIKQVANWKCYEKPLNRVKTWEDKSDTLTTHCGKDSGWMRLVWIPCWTQLGNSKNWGNSYWSEKAYTLRACNPNGVIEWITPMKIRKLTPIECERLQTLPPIKKEYGILFNMQDLEWFIEQAKSYVNVEDKNPKLQSVVGNVEKEDWRENVLFVERSLNINNQQIDKPAQKNVPISWDEEKQVKLYLNEQWIYVKFAEQSLGPLHLNLKQGSALWSVDINMLLEKIAQLGNDELLEKGVSFIPQKNGIFSLIKSGKEIMQLVKDAEKDLITLKKHSMSTILNHINTKNIEEILIILFYYVLIVIVGSIPEIIQGKNLFAINVELGYTYSISTAQRYKALGNWWTVEVISHIFRNLK